MIKNLTIFVLIFSFTAQSKDYFDLSLNELLDIKISTGALTSAAKKDSTSAITVIQQEQIELTAAKNISSLIEIYVPGLIVMEHSEGNKIGLRGNIAAENYKLLLLVNGKNITNMTYEGAILEIDQWELSDIERIEVVRGPGSVTYGTGAIAGVINIITKGASSNSDQARVKLSYSPSYQSEGVSIQFNQTYNDIKAFGFLSYRETKGYDNPLYYLMSPNEPTDIRYIGKRSTDQLPAQHYLADGIEPQIKAHIDIDFGNNFKLWGRYTQSGQTHAFTTQRERLSAEGDVIYTGDRRRVSTRSALISGAYANKISATKNIDINLTYDNQEYIRFDLVNPMWAKDHFNNAKDYAFSQERWTAQSLFHHQISKSFKYTFGYEYTNIAVGSPWHKNDNYLMIREGVHILNDINTSYYLQDLSLNSRPNPDRVVEAGKGIQFYSHTNLLEASYQISNSSQLIYSHRYDVPNMSENMFSPRLSFIHKINDASNVTLTVQKASRMMPLRAQYLFEQQKDNKSDEDHESIESIELSYSNHAFDNLSFNFRTFYNDIKVVGFTGKDLQFLGDIKLNGFDVEANYKYQNTDFIFNHSHINLIDAYMNSELKDGTNRNNITFADYLLYARTTYPLKLESYGNGLNNIPKNLSKFVITQQLFDNKLYAQINAQLLWDLDGSFDEMGMYTRAYDNVNTSLLSADELQTYTVQRAEFENEKRLLAQQSALDFDYNINLALMYKFTLQPNIKADINFSVENLLDSRKLYYVSTGSNKYYPDRLRFMEMPRSYQLSVTVQF